MIGTLRRRYGANAVPFIVISTIIIFVQIKASYKFRSPIYKVDVGFIIASIMLLLIPSYFIYYVFTYKICVDESSIFVKPLMARGPLMAMRFDEVATVDLLPNSDVVKTSNARANPSKIVLYRKGWDGQEMFALDPSRTNLKQFKNLVRLIHGRCPGTFTEDATRYLEGSRLITPREDRYGQLIWQPSFFQRLMS